MPTYAADTSVDSAKSRVEIERTLTRYGADQFMYGFDATSALVGFRIKGKSVKLTLNLPNRQADSIVYTPARGTERSPAQQELAYEQAVRQRWRALSLVIKAKLEAIEAGISTLEDEFLSALMLPDGSTAGDWLKPQIEEVYASGKMPERLPGLERPVRVALGSGRNGR